MFRPVPERDTIFPHPDIHADGSVIRDDWIPGETCSLCGEEVFGRPDVAEAYAAGLALETYEPIRAERHVIRAHAEFEMRIAVKNWREAQFDHGHTSYWGANHIRCMRAYWLGALRAKRGEA